VDPGQFESIEILIVTRVPVTLLFNPVCFNTIFFDKALYQFRYRQSFCRTGLLWFAPPPRVPTPRPLGHQQTIVLNARLSAVEGFSGVNQCPDRL
jgi:hypothetical protein